MTKEIKTPDDYIEPPQNWPENPYEVSLADIICKHSIHSDEEYAKAIPDEQLRSAVAFYLSNRAWDLCSQTILRWLDKQVIELIERYDWTSDKFQENFDGFDKVDYCEDFKEQIRTIFGIKDKDDG